VLQQAQHDVSRPLLALVPDQQVEGFLPLLRLLRVDVRETAGQAVDDGSGVLGGHVVVLPRAWRVAPSFHHYETEVTLGLTRGCGSSVAVPGALSDRDATALEGVVLAHSPTNR